MAVRAIEPPLPLALGFLLAPFRLAPLSCLLLGALAGVFSGQESFSRALRLAPLLLEAALPGNLLRLALGKPSRHGLRINPPLSPFVAGGLDHRQAGEDVLVELVAGPAEAVAALGLGQALGWVGPLCVRTYEGR
jgi:hypothetical protein